jgi:signal transduction histidine kinase
MTTTAVPPILPPFRNRLIVGAGVAMLVILGWLGFQVHVSFIESERLSAAMRRCLNLETVIMQLDERLTMSTRMAVATGDPQWRQRYRATEPELAAAIRTMTHLHLDRAHHQAALALQEANAEIAILEHQAMDLVRRDPGAAASILSGRRYADCEFRYAASVQALRAAMERVADRARQEHQETEVVRLAVIALGLFVTVTVGSVMLGRLHRWRTATRNSAIALQAAEARLDALRRQNDLILTHAAEGIYGLDLAGNLTFINPAAAAMLGWDPEDLHGRPLTQLTTNSRPADCPYYAGYCPVHAAQPDGCPYPGVDCPIVLALQRGESFARSDGMFWRKDGSKLPVSFASNPILDGGRIVGAVITFSDCTERSERERLQDETTRALSKAEAVKNQFLSMVSHELRTPVSVILSSANILSFQYGPYAPDGQKRHIDKITRNSQRLMGLLADLLDATQMEAGTFQLHCRPVQLDAVIDDAIDSVEHIAKERHQHIDRQIPPDLPTFAGDPDRLVQVLSNLLSNASKFTPVGGLIRVDVQIRDGAAHCAVTDTGPGIAAEKQGLLFQRFSRLDEPVHSEGRSMGLGLFIARALIEAHGGQLAVDSTPGEGSCFHFTLPLRATDGEG